MATDLSPSSSNKRNSQRIQRPSGVGAFEFAVLASLRVAQLIRGCRPRITSVHKNTVTAQLEIAQGKLNGHPAAVKARPVVSDEVDGRFVQIEQVAAVLARS